MDKFVLIAVVFYLGGGAALAALTWTASRWMLFWQRLLLAALLVLFWPFRVRLGVSDEPPTPGCDCDVCQIKREAGL